MQYLDKIAIGYGSVTGLKKDTPFVGDDYNWVASILFFGQLFFELPTIRILQLFPLAKYVYVNVIIWGSLFGGLQELRRVAGLSLFPRRGRSRNCARMGCLHVTVASQGGSGLPSWHLVLHVRICSDVRRVRRLWCSNACR